MPEERDHLSETEIQQGFRLACCTPVIGDMRVFIPEESLVKIGRIVEEGQAIEVPLDPAVQKLLVNVDTPHLEEIKSDLTRLLDQLPPHLELSLTLLQNLPIILREQDNLVTVTYLGSKVIQIQPGDHTSELYGIAIDIGSTTVVGYLVDLRNGQVLATHSILNPQTAHGEDIVTRLDFAVRMNGLQILQGVIQEGINSIIKQLCSRL